jgi:hypothetical protein
MADRRHMDERNENIENYEDEYEDSNWRISHVS